MKKKSGDPCVICNPADAEPGEYCSRHDEEIHGLEHKYESLFRFRRTSRGKDFESYDFFLEGKCDPVGRILATEVDQDNLAVTILLSTDLDLSALLEGYQSLGINKTREDWLRDWVRQEIVHSWYGNARACVDFFRTVPGPPLHWDVHPSGESADEEGPEDSDQNPPGSKHSVH